MGLTVDATPDNKEVTIAIEGRFDFNLYRPFRDAYLPHTIPGIHYVLNFGATDFMDSSALGMLLQLREHAEGQGAQITIRNCNSTLAKILRIANFQRLFTIEGLTK